MIILIQYCHIVPLWVSWIGKIRECDIYLALPVPHSFDHFCKAGHKSDSLGKGRAGKPSFPGGGVSIPASCQEHHHCHRPHHDHNRTITINNVICQHWGDQDKEDVHVRSAYSGDKMYLDWSCLEINIFWAIFTWRMRKPFLAPHRPISVSFLIRTWGMSQGMKMTVISRNRELLSQGMIEENSAMG